MKTETKVITGILTLTAIIIFGGIILFKGNMEKQGQKDYSKYVQTDLNLDKTKINRDYNPKITGATSTSQKTSSSTINITEFMDYECPACATNGETLNQLLLTEYGSNIIITRKIFPIHGQPSIDIASIVLASQILGDDSYQKIHQKVFETQSSWSILGKKDRNDYIRKMIIDMGIDYDKIATESKNPKYVTQIMQDKQDAIDLGITATPSYIIENKTRITGGLPLEEITKYIDNN